MILPSTCIVISDLLCVPYHCSAYEYQHKQKGLLCAERMGVRFVSLSRPFNRHINSIYLISEFCLVVKISSNIVTEKCRQVWVLSSMTAHVLPLRFPAVSKHVARTQTVTGTPRVRTVDLLTANRRGRASVVLILLTLWIWVIIYPCAFVGPGKDPSSNLTPPLPVIMLNCHFTWTRVTYCDNICQHFQCWKIYNAVIIKYSHWKNGSFEIYPALHFNLSLHLFSQFPLDVFFFFFKAAWQWKYRCTMVSTCFKMN